MAMILLLTLSQFNEWEEIIGILHWDLHEHTEFIIYLHDMKVKEDFKHANRRGNSLQNPVKESTNLQNSYLAHELRVYVHKNNIIN